MDKSLFQGYEMSVIDRDGESFARLNQYNGVVYVLASYKNQHKFYRKRLAYEQEPMDAVGELAAGNVTDLGQIELPEFLNTKAYLFTVELKKTPEDAGQWLAKNEIELTDNPVLALLALRAGIL